MHGEYKSWICYCSFCVVLEGFPTQKALAFGPPPQTSMGELQHSPIPPSWVGGVPPSRTLPGTAPLTVSPSPFQPPPPPTIQPGSASDIGVCCEVHPCGVVTTQTWVCAPFQHRTCTPEMSPLYSHTTNVLMLKL